MYVDPTHPHVVTRYYPAINTWHADDYSGGVHHRHVYTPHRDDPSNGHYILWRFGSGGAYRYVTGTISADNWLTIVARIPPAGQRPGPDGDLGVPPAPPEQGSPDGAGDVPDQAGRERALPGPVGELRPEGLPGGGAVPTYDPERHAHRVRLGRSTVTAVHAATPHDHPCPGPGHTHDDEHGGYGPAHAYDPRA